MLHMEAFSKPAPPQLAVKRHLNLTARVNVSLPPRLVVTLPACAQPGSVSLLSFSLQTVVILRLRAGKRQHFTEKMERAVVRFHILRHL